jgi:hypothetical protein
MPLEYLCPHVPEHLVSHSLSHDAWNYNYISIILQWRVGTTATSLPLRVHSGGDRLDSGGCVVPHLCSTSVPGLELT